jgi:elongation factor Ts
VNYEDVPAEIIEEARQRFAEDPSMARVPEARKEDVLKGKLNKEFSAQVLMLQPWVKDDAITINDLVRRVISATGENIVVRRFSRFALGE